MASFNRVILIGRLTREPELRYTTSGTEVVNFSLAVDRPKYKDKEKVTDFIEIQAWSKLAEICGKYLHKGSQVMIEGALQVHRYEKDGIKKTI